MSTFGYDKPFERNISGPQQNPQMAMAKGRSFYDEPAPSPSAPGMYNHTSSNTIDWRPEATRTRRPDYLNQTLPSYGYEPNSWENPLPRLFGNNHGVGLGGPGAKRYGMGGQYDNGSALGGGGHFNTTRDLYNYVGQLSGENILDAHRNWPEWQRKFKEANNIYSDLYSSPGYTLSGRSQGADGHNMFISGEGSMPLGYGASPYSQSENEAWLRGAYERLDDRRNQNFLR
jgi:hypothetical protein